MTLSGWEIAAPVLLGILVVAVIVFSVIRPSSAIRFGVFIERKILHDEKKKPPPADEAPTEEWPQRKDDRR